ncbi:MAG: DNA-directed RNA polymerase subunit L [Thermofilaceae archaeon]
MSKNLEITVVRNEENRLDLKVKGEDHALLNVLVEKLNEDPKVVFAAYKRDHPLADSYSLTVITNEGKSPLDALKEALEKVRNIFEELVEQVPK